MDSGISELNNFTQVPLFYGSKMPAIPWKKWVNKMPPEALQKYWFPKGIKRNKAILLSNNLAVLDFDNEEKYLIWKENNPSLANTLTVKTKRGYHCYFFVELGVFSVIGEDGIDIKTNGLVLLPPSRHEDGIYYEFINDNEIITVPDMDGLSVDFRVREYRVESNGILDGQAHESPIDRCVAATNLIEEISKLTKLIPYRNHFKAKCPFHNDKNPSLYVWHDHFFCYGDGCWANHKRDIVDLVMRQEGISIKEAIELILGEDDGRIT